MVLVGEQREAELSTSSDLLEAAAAAVVGPAGTPQAPAGASVFAWKGETLPAYWECTEAILTWPPDADGHTGPNMILDDGGDATMLVHKGHAWESAGQVPPTTEDDSEELAVFKALVRKTMAADAQKWTRVAAGIKGVTEETTTGVHRLYQLAEAGELLFDGELEMRFGWSDAGQLAGSCWAGTGQLWDWKRMRKGGKEQERGRERSRN